MPVGPGHSRELLQKGDDGSQRPQRRGGLGGAVAEVLAEAGAGTPLRRLGLQDVFACMVGSHRDLKERFGITAEAIVEAVC